MIWYNSRAKLTNLIDSAQSTLMIEQEEMDDTGIEDRLIAAARRGVAVIVTLAVFADGSTPSEDVRRLRAGGVAVRYSHTLYMHAKLILVDAQRAFVGSHNFSAVSLDANCEVGIIVADAAVVTQLASVVQSDWNASQEA